MVHDRITGLGQSFTSAQQLFQSGAIQDFCRRVADLLHDAAYPASGFIDAFIAATVCGLADARQKGDCSVQCANQFADRDPRRMSAQLIATTLALPALENSFAFQLQENDFEKFTRDVLAGGQICDQQRAASILPGKDGHGLEPILGLHGKHSVNILSIK